MISRSIARARTTRIFSVVIGSCRMPRISSYDSSSASFSTSTSRYLVGSRSSAVSRRARFSPLDAFASGVDGSYANAASPPPHVVLQRLLGAALRLEHVLRTVDGDAQQPGRKRVLPALAVEAIQRVERVDERLLRDVLGVGAAAQHAQRDGERQPLVTLDERAERLDVAVPGSARSATLLPRRAAPSCGSRAQLAATRAATRRSRRCRPPAGR